MPWVIVIGINNWNITSHEVANRRVRYTSYNLPSEGMWQQHNQVGVIRINDQLCKLRYLQIWILQFEPDRVKSCYDTIMVLTRNDISLADRVRLSRPALPQWFACCGAKELDFMWWCRKKLAIILLSILVNFLVTVIPLPALWNQIKSHRFFRQCILMHLQCCFNQLCIGRLTISSIKIITEWTYPNNLGLCN